ncbi:hypothetical protein [Pseudomonas luteola]|uniref:hypothetical protein n=1 Tax=Pseudomonas luteola TaxID=47886 RepID=UPI0015E3AF51|nr:hypothetical protein [Pseudomonas zeshuii]MBA1250899.1 hypothetical protein [Pseudomonas zeshuii]
MTKRVEITTNRPNSQARPGDIRAKAALQEPKDERIYFNGPEKYARGLKELKNLATNAKAEKNFIMEALDDLFDKYQRGDGRYDVPNLDELRRRLEGLQ